MLVYLKEDPGSTPTSIFKICLSRDTLFIESWSGKTKIFYWIKNIAPNS